MDREELIELLNDIEREVDVNALMFDDMHLWPAIKYRIFYNLYVNKFARKKFSRKSIKRNNYFDKIASYLNGGYNLFLYLFFTKKYDTLFCTNVYHNDKFQGVIRNKFSSPIIDNEKFLYINTSNKPFDLNVKGTIQMVSILNLLNRFRKKEVLNKINKTILNEIFNCIKKSTNTFDLKEEEKINNYLIQLISNKNNYCWFFNKLLYKTKARCIYTVAYYTDSIYYLNYCANKLEIETIDLQHGGQGPLHVAYTRLNKVPLNGYNILPKIFDCWDDYSAEEIRKWASKQQFHQAIVGGNKWHKYIASFNLVKPTDKKIILVTLQFDFVDEVIIECMQQCKLKNIEWWFRVHPTRKNGLGKIREQLIQNNINHFNLEEANDAVLPVILSWSSLHISRYSGSIIEADLLNIPSIIIDPVGAENYQNLIESQSAYYCETSIEIIEKISHLLD